MIKKLLIILTAATLCYASAQAIVIELTQKVSRREDRQQIYINNNSYDKTVTRSKTFTLTVSNGKPIEIIVVFFTTAGGKVASDVVTGQAAYLKPFVYESSASASSNTVKIDFTYIEDYLSKSGNDKVECAAFVFDKATCKFLGSKFTSGAFADQIMKSGKQAIIDIVKAESAK